MTKKQHYVPLVVPVVAASYPTGLDGVTAALTVSCATASMLYAPPR
jgi:hypothetical protein